jgi:hypothetical protein
LPGLFQGDGPHSSFGLAKAFAYDLQVISQELTTRRGAYGLHLPTIAAQEWLNGAPMDWRTWTFASAPTQSVDSTEQVTEVITDAEATVRIAPTGYAHIDRGTATTTLHTPRPLSPEGMIHPHLGSTAVMNAYWAGYTTFHGGSFVLDGGVWALLGDRQQGKSSALAWLVRRGLPIFADDLLILDGDRALAGPRCLDLRREAAEYFGIGEPIGIVGTRHRWRYHLPPVPAALPFRGWVTLAWADDVDISLVPPADRLPHLLASRGLTLIPTDLHAWLDLIRFPLLILKRPNSWNELDGAMNGTLDRLAELAPVD